MANSLISPATIRKAKLISSYTFLICIIYVAITFSFDLDTRILHFELRDMETARTIYNLNFFNNHSTI